MKKLLFKLLKISGITLLIILTGIIVLIFFTGPKLPANTDTIIENIINSKPPELVKGQSGYVISDGYKIWYESITPKDTNKGVILLFMGMATDALMWPQAFIDEFVDSDYQTIRFDYRGVGASDWIEEWEEKPYSVADLAKDAKVIIDTLEVSKVHLVGMSLGGMVAQEFATKNPDRTLYFFKKKNSNRFNWHKNNIELEMKPSKISTPHLKGLKLSNRDLDFLAETVTLDVTDKFRLKQIIREDEHYRSKFISKAIVMSALTSIFKKQ